MLQLKNDTPFAAEIALFPNAQGIDTLYTIMKATFCYAGGWALAEEQILPQAEDEYWGEPGQSSLKSASDFHTGKPASDVIVIGSACAKDRQEVKQLQVSVNVASLSKTVLVTGNRVWQHGNISKIEPFKTMPIVYEKAFGGCHVLDQATYLAEEKNPVGCGFSGKRSMEEMHNLPLPNIEEPTSVIRQYSDRPKPAGFGFCSPNWLPRRQYAGTYDEAWQQNRAPYLPTDFDSRFLNCAHPDLIYPGYLQGGEAFSISNMHPEGTFSGNIPQLSAVSDIRFGSESNKSPMNLETVVFEPNKKTISMVWRSAFECDKRALKITEIGLSLAR